MLKVLHGAGVGQGQHFLGPKALAVHACKAGHGLCAQHLSSLSFFWQVIISIIYVTSLYLLKEQVQEVWKQ